MRVLGSGRLRLGILALVVVITASGCVYLGKASVSSSGAPGNGESANPALSSDGRYVAFDSSATNLVSGDTNGAEDVFVRDLAAGTTDRVSVGSGGVQANGSSNVASSSAISAHGNVIVFQSFATNLPGAPSDGSGGLYVRDRQAATTERVDVTTGGAGLAGFGGSISGDGRYVAFSGFAGGSPGAVYVRDRQSHTTTMVSVNTAGVAANDESEDPYISANGARVAFTSFATNLVAGDTNGFGDVFVRDLTTHTTIRASVSTGGAQGNGFSGHGPALSGDGRYVAFPSTASNLVSGDTNGFEDVFVRDTQMSTTTRVDVSSSGAQANDFSDTPAVPMLSGDGRYVVFNSFATNLGPDTIAGRGYLYVRDRVANTTLELLDNHGHGILGAATAAALSGDGHYVALASDTDPTGGGDIHTQIYVRYVQAPSVTSVAPTSAARGATVTLTINGSWFLPNSRVMVANATVNTVTYVSASQLHASVSVPANAHTGATDVTVENLGTGPGGIAGATGTCIGCLRIT